MAEETSYIPGVCNINPKEIAQRRLAGHIGLVMFVVILAPLLLIDINRLIRIVLFAPALLAAVGYLQAKNHFCVGYAGAGQQNATPGSDKAAAITDTSALAADKKRARQINTQAAAIAAVITAICLLIPHI